MMRLRLRTQTACAAFALPVAAVALATAQAAPATLPLPPSPPLRVEVGQLIVTGFTGTSAPAWLRTRLARRELGGVVLFGRNVVSRAQVAALDAQIERAAGGTALISLDQEGGQVRRLPWASPLRDQSLQSSATVAFRSARAAARDLAAVGANVNLAPVADVALGRGSEMRRRAFPGGATAVAQLVRADLRGYAGTSVMPTVKHFPGFGAARTNTDDAPVRIDRTRAQLRATELRPFVAAIAARAPFVMVSHALYPAYDGAHIASQSPAIMRTLLRGQLGFKGVVMTDGLEARAVLARSDVATAAERSIAAGADVVLLGTSASYGPVFDKLLARARSDRSFRARVAAAYARIRALKLARLASTSQKRAQERVSR